MKITLKINGNEEIVDVAEGTPLLWVLRDRLDLTGTKWERLVWRVYCASRGGPSKVVSD